MTDYRDPQYRDPNPPGYRDPAMSPIRDQPWSAGIWAWVAGIAAVALVLIVAFGGSEQQVATDRTAAPPTTTGQGQRTMPAPPATGPKTDAPSMNRPEPAPKP